MFPFFVGISSAVHVSKDFVKYQLIPAEAKQGWQLELFEVAEDIPSHDHKLQKQFLIGAEGKFHVICDGRSISLSSSEFVCVEPGQVHAVRSETKGLFFAVDLPGFPFPEDVYEPEPMETFEWQGIPEALGSLDSSYYQAHVVLEGYRVYEIASSPQKTWSVALLEIHTSPRHVHFEEEELFIVVRGTLDLEVEGEKRSLTEGEAVKVIPGKVHQLLSGSSIPVQVLCFSFPAFDPSDMHLVP